MIRPILGGLCALLILATALPSQEVQDRTRGTAGTGSPPQQARPARGRSPGGVIYKLKDGVDPEQAPGLQAVIARHGLAGTRQVVGDRTRVQTATHPQGSEEDIAADLIASGAVVWAEPDYVVSPVLVPNDPSYGSQWQHAKIRSDLAWDIHTGSGITIAIVDSGVDSDHPDLMANLVPGRNMYYGSSDTEDSSSHGTRVAGSAAAIGNNGIGVSGVIWNARIMPVRVTADGADTSTLSLVASGIRWAADNGAKVINASWSGTDSSSYADAATYAAGKGAFAVFSGGNSGIDTATWRDTTDMIVVGATTRSDGRASWSNYGKAIDLFAPGDGIYTTQRGGGYTSTSGTSFSAPITAGAIALLMSAKPTASMAEIRDALLRGCVDLGTPGEDAYWGWGRLDVYNSLRILVPPGAAAPVAVATASAQSGPAPLSVTFNGSGSSDPDGDILTYAWDVDGNGTTDYTGVTATHIYTAAGAYTARLTVSDGLRSHAAALTVQVSPDLTPPSAPINLVADGVISDAAVVSWGASSDNIGVTGYQVAVNGGVPTTVTGTSRILNGLTASTAYTVTVKAVDAAGNLSAAASVSFTTLAPAPGTPITITASEDTYVDVDNKDSNFGTATMGSTLRYGDTVYTKFNLAALAGQTVTSARIRIYVSESAYGQAVVSAYAIDNDAWGENTATYNTTRNLARGTELSYLANVVANTWVELDVTPFIAAQAVGDGVATIEIANPRLQQRQYGVYLLGHTTGNVPTLLVQVESESDTSPPSIPTGLLASGITSTGATMSWTASSDNVGVIGYQVAVNGGMPTTVTGTSQALSGLTASTAYTVTVQAVDAAGNRSAAASVGFTTLAPPDISAPSAPTGLLASGITSTGATMSWTASSDNVGVTGYQVAVNGGTPTTVTGTSQALSGLTASTAYTVTVQAVDAAGNRSAAASVGFITLAPAVGTTHAIVASEDTYADVDNKDSAFGAATSASVLRYGDTVYAKFDLASLAGRTVTSARIRIYVSESAYGQAVLSAFPIDHDAWSETTATYNSTRILTRGTELSYLANVVAKTWVELDVTAFIAAQAAGDGIATIEIANPRLQQRQFGVYLLGHSSGMVPQLVVESLAEPAAGPAGNG